jgi:anti-sigma factor RsiW
LDCAQLQSLLAAGAPLDAAASAHLDLCPGCQARQRALAELDAALDAEFGHVLAPATLAANVKAKLAPARLSPVPAILDLIAYCGVAAAALALLWFLTPPWETWNPQLLLAGLCVTLLGVALGGTAWALRDSES